MALTTDQVLISNQALLLVGVGRIHAPDEDSEQAIVCGIFFSTTLDEVITSNNWNCARHRASLALDATAPAFGWSHQFTLPTNPYCLFVTKDDDGNEFVVEGRKLLSDSTTFNAHYLKRVTNLAELSTKLVEVLILKLAAKVCIPLQGDLQLLQAAQNAFNVAEAKNSGRASQEGDERPSMPSGGWQNVRNSRPVTGRTGYK